MMTSSSLDEFNDPKHRALHSKGLKNLLIIKLSIIQSINQVLTDLREKILPELPDLSFKHLISVTSTRRETGALLSLPLISKLSKNEVSPQKG